MSKVEENLSKVIRDASQIRLKAHLKLPEADIQVKEADIGEDIHEIWLSLILVSCIDVRISFKVFFQVSDVKRLIFKSMKSKMADISDDLVFDFMNEYCNLTAGLIQQSLSKQDIKAGISLPMVSRGFDDLYFSSPEGNGKKSSWIINVEGVELTCISEILVMNDERLSSFEYVSPEEKVQSDKDIFDF